MQPQYPAQIRITENGPWHQAAIVHRCRNGRYLAQLDDGTVAYAADVRMSHSDASAALLYASEQAEAIGNALRSIPVSARNSHYYDACRYLAMAYGELVDAAAQVEVQA